ncbi:MAG: NADH-quinone oxidoreductase subunit NuoH [Alphaproteobacteria bacterium]|jgi:NADH-quinone oxidoreductase subunit H|nr:NADH-quinone oxidoreductase subunit NuoH [Alphaproteobacteria bacterium]MDP7190292.1 NADH-quinone oxidoreductase subunit NuoH [Alphaproteobacteria bacterium]MDP7456970.1 NADH-quinone oxidoreductase subunit NuoH [Alphaproteobacteria bacterium]HJO88677.1 NADH-quinone oxidoreductase subunit NuoH [Alphaproteobacteria bacterium]|tara:strand:+ start:279 stop:1265 length:987 start_codon:yes stop_codon:yes gene_type:complete
MESFFAIGLIIGKLAVVIAILLVLPIPLTWIERKIAGHIQQRLGPMRVGWHGLLQPLADGIKLLTKEDHIPAEADRFLFTLAPIIALVPPFLVFVAIPIGDSVTIFGTEITLYLADMNVGLLYILAVAGIEVYGVIFAGWASNSKYAVLGSLRTCAQMISYEIPMGFSVIGVVMLAHSMSLLDIVEAQAGLWNVVYQPLGFFVFFVAGLAEAQRIPFDLPEAEGDLCAGYHTEYSGIRFSFFMISEYLIVVFLSALIVLLFFGGWHGILIPLPPVVWFLLKLSFFIWVFMWLRFTFPRYRYDQLMSIGWKVLLPLSLANILISGIFML